jgi:methanethiol S-methyltransferase
MSIVNAFKKVLLRYFFYIMFLFAIIFFLGPIFWTNIQILFSSEYSTVIIQERWDIALIYIILFSLFILFLSKHPLKKNTWKKHSLYISFFVALFAEMFGFPLSVYFISGLVKLPTPRTSLVTVFSSSMLGLNYQMDINTFFALAISFFAFILIAIGWKKIYKSEGLVTDGIYKYTRNPQYLGIILIISVWVMVWPTLIIVIMWPILCYFYYGLAKAEEKHLQKTFAEEFMIYKKKVPLFLPHIEIRRRKS